MPSPTNFLLAPQPNQVFAVPSGATYQADTHGIIYNVASGDVAPLEAVGCIPLNARNNAAASAPTGANDYTQLYGVGSLWELTVSPYTLYMCTSPTPAGSATWEALSGTSGIGGALTGNIRTVSTTFSISNSDKGNTIVGSSSSMITGTVASIGSLDSNWQVKIQNTGSRVIFIDYTGSIGVQNPYVLCPTQSVTIENSNGAFTFDPPFQRWNNNNIGININVESDGNDAYDGLASGPSNAKQTIYGAYYFLRNSTDTAECGIDLIPGDSLGATTLLAGDANLGFGRLFAINGDPTMSMPTKLVTGGGQSGLSARDGGWIQVFGVEFGSSGSDAIGVNNAQGGLIDIGENLFASMTAGLHISAADRCDCNIIASSGSGTYTINGNAAVHWYTIGLAKLTVGTVTIDCSASSAFSIAFIEQSDSSLITVQSPTFSGSGITGPQWDLNHHSILDTNGTSSSIPGVSGGNSVDATSNVY